MTKKQHETPLLDELEKGPWPSFVSGLKRLAQDNDMAADLLDFIEPHVQPGITTDELNNLCHQHQVEVQKTTPAPLNYRGFPRSICTSVNHVVCHGIPSDKKLKQGDIINVDVTPIADGWHGDASRTFAVGKVAPATERLIDVMAGA